MDSSVPTDRISCFALLSLPVEVIDDILAICALSEPPRRGSIGWIRLGHIRRTLRQILLDMPVLWASIPFQLPKGDEEIIRRAQDIPLVIDLLRPPYYLAVPIVFRSQPLSRPLLQQLDSHLSRAQTIFLPPIVPNQFLSTLADKDFPFLRNVKLVSDRDHGHFPTRISLAHAPFLRHLTMHNCVITCDYSTLESLNMRFQGHQDILFPTGSLGVFDGHTLLESVSLAANLRRLTISGFLFKNVSPPAPMTFPHLEDLHIGTPHDFCAAIWKVISVPAGARLAIHVDDYLRQTWISPPLADAEAQERIDLMGAVARHFTQSGSPRINGIRLDCVTTRLFLTVQEKGAVMHKLEGPFSKDHAFVLDVRMVQMDRLIDLSTAAPLVLLEQIPRNINPPFPLTLELFKLGRYSTAQWRQSLTHLSAVHTLVLDEFPPRNELWDAICPGTESAPATAPVLPQLKTVYFAVGNLPRSHGGLMFAGDDSDEDTMPELESVSHITDEMGDFLQGDDRMYARFGYESGGGGRDVSDTGAGAGDTTEPRSPDGQETGSDAIALRPSPWGHFVAALKQRADQGIGVQRIVFGPHWRRSLGEGPMLRLKSDTRAVVPEVVEIPSVMVE